jgi:hypothetical protein
MYVTRTSIWFGATLVSMLFATQLGATHSATGVSSTLRQYGSFMLQALLVLAGFLIAKYCSDAIVPINAWSRGSWTLCERCATGLSTLSAAERLTMALNRAGMTAAIAVLYLIVCVELWLHGAGLLRDLYHWVRASN